MLAQVTPQSDSVQCVTDESKNLYYNISSFCTAYSRRIFITLLQTSLPAKVAASSLELCQCVAVLLYSSVDLST